MGQVISGISMNLRRAAQANIEINDCIRSNEDRLRADPDPSALSMMINVDEPIEYSQIMQISKSQSVAELMNRAMRFRQFCMDC